MSHEPAAGTATPHRRVTRVAIFGATGMVGEGVLRECLRDADVVSVLAIGRRTTGQQRPKLIERAVPDLTQLADLAADLETVDACFYCVGVSSVGMSEDAYRKVTYDLAVGVAGALVAINPAMSFVYVSGEGSDSSGRGRQMWARVKGEAENAVHAMPFAETFAFRPGAIQPLDGISSRLRLYRVIYAMTALFYPLLLKGAPRYVTDTRRVGLAMLYAVRHGAPHWIVHNRDINLLAERAIGSRSSSVVP